MEERLEEIKTKGLEKINQIKAIEEVQEITRELTGKKSELNDILRTMGSLSDDMKKTIGIKTTEIKNLFTSKLKDKEEELINAKSVVDVPLDLTIPGTNISNGSLHPITQMCYDLNEAFLSLGFEVYSEDDISSEKFAFDNLNFPADHPARQSMDTFWVEGTEDKLGNERLCLRPHLTGGSVRYLLKHGAPARFVYPGRVYRNENTDARHERAFFQYEALIVDKNISFSSGMVMIQTILEKVFGRKINVRMREGFFPFTEPGYEIDMECLVCGGKGCKVCNHNGWIEVMPGGVIHPNVLKSAGLNPEEWTGFYINIGLDRLVMMRYGVDDVRLFHSADLRFLKQFK
ncbi:MAG: phenylalanine--tRNA ligase subunit alpha [Candidatus Faecisoma sp.]|nr:phenylalanine--tRNA ligase subunit alpha [Acholeplasma sp.]MCI5678062.1 phenylalanine--tRNA ligase subunit alpha [Acholeplasma sp.]MDY2892619.1 phenylalanine--tRNA ligase subunit alpha [Candidatus Faecisoma sp.]CCY28036.1 phenylalanine--tRNA ligase alpha subunit [Acholeplasma sp. CAG:878]